LAITTVTEATKVKLSAARDSALKSINPELNDNAFLNFLAMVKTKDEKDEGKVKLFPRKKYIKDLAHLFQHEKLLLIPKSRQMTISWLAVAYCVWRAYTRPNQLILWQSKNFDDAAAMVFDRDDPQVARASFVCWHLPEYIFDRPKPSQGNLLWNNGSIVKAIKQGADVIRSRAASVIISDEMGFQEEAANAYMAAKPAITGGGQFIGISSANAGFFWDLVEDVA
jgi:hypothetical protein